MTDDRSGFDLYDDNYASCEETRCTLRIYTGLRDPDVISIRLGVQPTSTSRIGRRVTNRLGRGRIERFNGWFLCSENHVKSKDLRRHLDWLTDLLLPAKGELHALQDDPDIRMEVSCVWWSKSGHGGPVLSVRQMRDLTTLGLELGFDLYFLDPDEPSRLRLAIESAEE